MNVPGFSYGRHSLRPLPDDLRERLQAAVDLHGAAVVGKACDSHPDAIAFALGRKSVYAGTKRAIVRGLKQLANERNSDDRR